MEKRLNESCGIETVLIRTGLPCIANHQVLVRSLQSQCTWLASLVDILTFAYTNRIFVPDTAGKITDRNIGLPEIGSLAIQHQWRFLGPTQNRFLRLDHAKTLPILGTIMNLKINVHDIVFF